MSTIRLFLSKFFPITLFLLVLRRNLVLLALWIALFSLVSGNFLTKYGMPFLFLSPEYLNEVGPLSFFIIGLCAGLFTMAFHISTYVFHSLRFPFLATLRRPLFRFAINNSIIPISFFAFYAVNIYRFEETVGWGSTDRWLNIASLFAGSILIIALVVSYFFSTLRPLNPPVKRNKPSGLGLLAGRMKVEEIDELKEQEVYAYLRNFANIRLARNARHYSRDLMIKTIHRHHVSAVVFSVVLLLIMTAMGYFGDSRWLEIPAGGTVFLLLSLGLLVYTIIHTWFKGWSPLFLVLLVLVVDQTADWSRVHPAYGMRYGGEQAVLYNDSTIALHNGPEIQEADMAHWTKMLEQWKLRTGEEKPRLILLNVSGGGLRSSVFTYAMWRYLDEQSDGAFSRHCVLITGASGGMMGAAYYREQLGNRWQQYPERSGRIEAGQQRVGLDLLNPTAFNLVVNDLLVRFRQVDVGGHRYAIDRGYAFDRKLINNTDGQLGGELFDRGQGEREALIPPMIFSPTIVNDGRRLLISPQPTSFLCTPVRNNVLRASEIDGIELGRMFESRDARSLQLATAVRMSASFPYITPMVQLPSMPELQLIDAGVRDNDGFGLALRFAEALSDWIETNTSGVLVIRFRGDRPEQVEISEQSGRWTGRWLRPVGGVVRSFTNLQTYSKVEMRERFRSDELRPAYRDYYLFKQDEEFALSWHLTEREKRRIEQAVEQLYADSAEIAYWEGFFGSPSR